MSAFGISASLIALGISLDAIIAAAFGPGEIVTADPSESAALEAELDSARTRIASLSRLLEQASETIREQELQSTQAPDTPVMAGRSSASEAVDQSTAFTLTAGKGFDFEERLVQPSDTVGVDFWMADSAAQQLGGAGGIVRISKRGFPSRDECASALETVDGDEIGDYAAGQNICARTWDGDVVAIRVANVLSLDWSTEVDFNYRLLE